MSMTQFSGVGAPAHIAHFFIFFLMYYLNTSWHSFLLVGILAFWVFSSASGDKDALRVIPIASLLFFRRKHAIHNSDSTSSSSDDEQFQRRRNKNRSRPVNRWEWRFKLQQIMAKHTLDHWPKNGTKHWGDIFSSMTCVADVCRWT